LKGPEFHDRHEGGHESLEGGQIQKLSQDQGHHQVTQGPPDANSPVCETPPGRFFQRRGLAQGQEGSMRERKGQKGQGHGGKLSRGEEDRERQDGKGRGEEDQAFSASAPVGDAAPDRRKPRILLMGVSAARNPI